MTDQPVTKKKPTTAERLDNIVEMMSAIGENQLQTSRRLDLLESAHNAPPKPSSFFDERVRPTLLFARKHWLTIIIICWIALHYFPFVEGTARLGNLLPTPNPLVQKLDINGIVNQSPNDSKRRSDLVRGYKNVIESIEEGWTQDMKDAGTKTREETGHVLKLDEWKETSDRLGSFIGDCSDLSIYKDKLYEIADAFERAAK